MLSAVAIVAVLSAVGYAGYRYLNGATPAKVAVAQPVRLSGATEVYFRVPGPQGRMDVVGVTARSLGLAGKSSAALRKAFPDWTVETATPGGVSLVPRKGGDPIYLGLRSGYVTIFLGQPQRGLVDEITGIPADQLMAQDRQRLARGIGVKSLTDAWTLLEGLSG